jgi:SEC-C motif-containing protein
MCHCGRSQPFSECCEPYISGKAFAPTAEALMRSRYSAFVEKNFDYLFMTTDPQTKLAFDHEQNKKWALSVTFTQLDVVIHEEKINKGMVEFVAHFVDNATGKKAKHHEVSVFRKQNGIWFYREGRAK